MGWEQGDTQYTQVSGGRGYGASWWGRGEGLGERGEEASWWQVIMP
jgi:hypothetical protein